MSVNFGNGSGTSHLQRDILWNGQLDSLPYVLLDDLPHLVWVKDLQGRYLYINEAYRRFHCVSDDNQRIGLTDAQVYPEPLASLYHQQDLQVFASRLPLKIEDVYSIESPRYPAIYETIKRPLFSSDGRVIAAYGVSRDITASKAEAAKASRQNQLLAALHEVSLELMKQHNIQVLLQIILQRSAQAIGAPAGFMNFIDPESDTMMIVHTWGEEAVVPENYRVRKGQALAGRVWSLAASSCWMTIKRGNIAAITLISTISGPLSEFPCAPIIRSWGCSPSSTPIRLYAFHQRM